MGAASAGREGELARVSEDKVRAMRAALRAACADRGCDRGV